MGDAIPRLLNAFDKGLILRRLVLCVTNIVTMMFEYSEGGLCLRLNNLDEAPEYICWLEKD